MKKIFKFILPISALAASFIPLTACDGSNNDGDTSGVKVINTNTTLNEGEFTSETSDKKAVLVNGSNITVKLSNLILNKTGDCTSTDDSHFYGSNSGLLAKGGATAILDNLNVTTDAKGANGVFAYGGKSSTKEGVTGDGTNITIKNSTITTSKDESGGVMVAGHGSLTATDCIVTTSGNSSAPIRSDRGGDTMVINGGTYTSDGKGSPAIYSTATVTASNATLISNHSSGVVVEGSNFVTLTSCDLEDTNNQLNGQSTSYKNIFLYQSASGDASSGNDGITIDKGTIKTHYGDSFYVTNQTSEINLNNVTITNDSPSLPSAEPAVTNYFLRAKADAWGKSGKNGGHVTLNTTQQTIGSEEKPGNIDIDSISTLNLNLKTSSIWTGALTNANKSTSGVVVTIDSTSSWKLTGDSYVGKLGDTVTKDRIDVNGFKLYGWNGTTWEVIIE